MESTNLSNEASAPQQLASERLASTILPQMLGSFDLTAILILIVFFATNAPLMSGAGAAGFTFWLLAGITFLIPSAVATHHLGRLFPGEGSLYIWTTKAMGPFFGFLAGFSAWFPGVLGLVATAVGAMPFLHYLAPAALAAPWQQGVVLIGIIALLGLLASLRFQVTKTMTNLLFLGYAGVIVLLALAGVLAWIQGRAAPVDYAPAHWMPTGGNLTFYGVATLGLLGIEVPLNMGAEIKNPRAISRYLLWGSLTILGFYLLSTFGVLSAVPLAGQGNLDAIVVAIQVGFGGVVGQVLADLAAVFSVGLFLWVTVVFNYSFARLPFTSGLDRRLPLMVSRVNRFHLPWVALLIQSVIAIVLTSLIYLLAPLFARQVASGDLATAIYDVVQAALAIIWCLSLVFLFLSVTILVRTSASDGAHQKKAPGWVFFLCAGVGSVASLAAIVGICTTPWTSLLDEGTWLLWIVGLLLFCLAAGCLLFFFGERSNRIERSDAEVIEAVSSHEVRAGSAHPIGPTHEGKKAKNE